MLSPLSCLLLSQLAILPRPDQVSIVLGSRYLAFTLPLRTFRTAPLPLPFALTRGRAPLFGNGVAKGCELRHKLSSLGRARTLMLALHSIQSILLLVEGEISEPRDDGIHCKLSSHFQILTMLHNKWLLACLTRVLK